MTTVHHVNAGTLITAANTTILCHCLLLEDAAGLALVDTGIGLEDVRRPAERIGQDLIDAFGFQFNEADTAVRQLEKRGFRPPNVRHVLLTHGDPDHAGGLADFPQAQVHLSAEEHTSITAGHPRYRQSQFSHGPRWQTYGPADHRWFGLEARPVALGFSTEVLLIPLFGHTLGHCGVAVRQGGRWVLHVGDAYYLRVETVTDVHPVAAISARAAVNDALRRASLEQIRRLVRDHAVEIDFFGYHDPIEFPAAGARS